MQVTKGMSLQAFEEQVDQTITVISSSGIPVDRTKTRNGMLNRLAALEGVTPAEAEQLLKDRDKAPAAPVVEEPKVEAKPRAKRKTGKDADEAESFFWVKPQDAAFMDMFFEIRRNEGMVANLLVTGPSGSGKTEGLLRAGKKRGVPVYKVDCASITTTDKWVGHKEVDEKGTHYVLSEHLMMVSAQGMEPGLVVYDEINRLHPSLLNILIPILDGSQSIWVPEIGQRINVHPQTLFAATANIGAGYAGTYKLDDALSGRFGFRIEQGFPPPDQEVQVLTNRTGVDQAKAKTLVEIAAASRNKVTTSELSFAIATRNLLDTAVLVASGMSIMEAAEYTYIKQYSEESGSASERTMIKQITAGKAGARP